MPRTAFVIMAAGLSSRFDGIKQLTSFGAGGELLIDFSIFDALETEFNQIVFVIRPELEDAFRARIGDRVGQIVETHYVYQKKEMLPSPFVCPPLREKPWGTGQAILACRDVVHTPFAVINADDYYGKSVLRQIYAHLMQPAREDVLDICMAGFLLRNTLSDFGGVTRGICTVDDAGMLQRVREVFNIERRGDSAFSVSRDGRSQKLDMDSVVSMNILGFRPAIFPELEQGFCNFLQNNLHSRTTEFVLPTAVDDLVQERRAVVKVLLPTQDNWFGVTYREDVPAVREAFARLLAQGAYLQKLF